MGKVVEESLSLTALTSNFKEDGLIREAILAFLVNDMCYVKDIKEITGKGLLNGVTYRYKEGDSSQKWPVYDRSVQQLVLDHIEEIKEKYGDLEPVTRTRNGRTVKRHSPQPEKIPMDEYPAMIETDVLPSGSFVVYDFETTGKMTARDAIIEIGAIRVVNGRVKEEKGMTFQELVKPYKQTIHEDITQLTGITKEDVADARPIWEVMKDFMDFVGDDVMVGFNNVVFDSKFLARAGRVSGIKIYNKQYDVLKLARAKGFRADNGKQSLSALSDCLGIRNPQAHRALADAITTAKVLNAIKGM